MLAAGAAVCGEGRDPGQDAFAAIWVQTISNWTGKAAASFWGRVGERV